MELGNGQIIERASFGARAALRRRLLLGPFAGDIWTRSPRRRRGESRSNAQ